MRLEPCDRVGRQRHEAWIEAQPLIATAEPALFCRDDRPPLSAQQVARDAG